MSHLRAPAARDRREGGRHGRPVARTAPALPEAHIRSQLLRLAVLPPVAVALSGCAAVLFTVRSTGVRPSLTLWGVLAGAVFVTLVGIAVAAVAAGRAARSVHDRVGALRRATARREADLRALVEALRRGDGAPARQPRGGPAEGAGDFELLAADLARAHDGAVTAVVQASKLSSQAGSEQKLEVFVNLARRLQSLVHREISILDDLENEIEDPDLLKGLFHVDHLATRIRRHAENLAVLGGAVSRRQWSNPVSMTEVLRSAIAEVEQYSRVKLVPPIDGRLRGHAVADVIHLLAELVENATVFSAPHTQVLLRANLVTSGLAVEVEDRGLGMPPAEQDKMNALLTDPDQVNVASLLADGRIGLFVVSQLARRHGITVRLQTNIYGGVQAVLVVPQALLGPPQGVPAGSVPQQRDGSGAGTDRAAVPTHRHPQPTSATGTAATQGPGSGLGATSVAGHGTGSVSGAGHGTGAVSPAGHGAGAGHGAVPVPESSLYAGEVPASGTSFVVGGGAGVGSSPVSGGGSGVGSSPVSGAGAVGSSSVHGEVAASGSSFVVGGGSGVGSSPVSGAGAVGSSSVHGEVAASGSSFVAGGFSATGSTPVSGGVPTTGSSPVSEAASDPGTSSVPGAGTGGGLGSAVSESASHVAGTTVPSGGTRRERREAARAAERNRGGPAPLPVRGVREERANPAEAVPGIRPDDRRILDGNTGAPPAPLSGTVRGTMGKPQLPRRRAQEHIAPQLRGGPTPRQDSEHVPGHDPGLMAAFQRGMSLAEAQQQMEPGQMEPGRMDRGQTDPGPMDLGHLDAPALLTPLDTPRTTDVRPAHTPAPHEAHRAHDDVFAPRPDHTARHDGSAPAG